MGNAGSTGDEQSQDSTLMPGHLAVELEDLIFKEAQAVNMTYKNLTKRVADQIKKMKFDNISSAEELFAMSKPGANRVSQ